MRTRIATLAAVALALIAGPTLAHAQETEQEKPDAADRTAMFEKLDRNGDGVLDEGEFDAFQSWLGHHRAMMIENPAKHAMMMEAWQKRMHDGVHGEPMMERPANWKSPMDVTKQDDFVASYWRMFDRDEDASISREEWDEAFDLLYPGVHAETRAEGGVNRQTEW